ncbi:hypothetical protein M758_9G146200 [Ceratodon purpureus]|nr:hypothetical protein M758_9G146200 [Ceratodon purpureus]
MLPCLGLGEMISLTQFCCWRFSLLHTDTTKMTGPRHDVIAVFNKAKAIFFYKTITTSMVSDSKTNHVMYLELPTLFVTEHGEKMSQAVALVRPASCGSGKWWLRFEGRHSVNYPSRIFTFGGGWRDFVVDNGISIGEFLVFELVNTSRLVVHVYPRDDQLGVNSRGFSLSADVVEDSERLNLGLGDANHKNICQNRPTRPSLPPVKVALEFSEFKKTLCATNVPNGKIAKIDIPTPFWRSHGEDKFDKKVYTLEGPWTKGDVKAYVCRTWRQTKCLFIGGWQAFCVANKLKIGDTVVFSLTGQYQFAVSVEA